MQRYDFKVIGWWEVTEKGSPLLDEFGMMLKNDDHAWAKAEDISEDCPKPCAVIIVRDGKAVGMTLPLAEPKRRVA